MDYQQKVTPITAYTQPKVRGKGIRGHVAYYEAVFGLQPHSYTDDYPSSTVNVGVSPSDQAPSVSQSRPALDAIDLDEYNDDISDESSPSTCSCSASHSHECKSETIARVVGLPNSGEVRISSRGDKLIMKKTEWLDLQEEPIEPAFVDHECHHDPTRRLKCHNKKILQITKAPPAGKVYMDPKLLHKTSPYPLSPIALTPPMIDGGTTNTSKGSQLRVSESKCVSVAGDVIDEGMDVPGDELEEEEELIDEEADVVAEEVVSNHKDSVDDSGWEEESENVDCQKEGVFETADHACLDEGEVVEFNVDADDALDEVVNYRGEDAGWKKSDDWESSDGEKEGDFEWAPIESVDMVVPNQASECALGSFVSDAQGHQNSDRHSRKSSKSHRISSRNSLLSSHCQSNRRSHTSCALNTNIGPISSQDDRWVVLPFGRHGHTHRIRFS